MSQVDRVLFDVRSLVANITSMNHEELYQLGVRGYEEVQNMRLSEDEMEQLRLFLTEVIRFIATDLPMVQSLKNQITRYYPQQVGALQSWIKRWSSVG